MNSKLQPNERLLLVVMDGIGLSPTVVGDAYYWANKPHIEKLKNISLSCELFAHGTYVGMPSNSDLGNSEVGHNAIGAGRIFEQGAKLVQKAIQSEEIFRTPEWNKIVQDCSSGRCLHFIGLLSDGNVHSHEGHLYALIGKAVAMGVKKIRVHALLDGRDVSEGTAELYLARLNRVLKQVNSQPGVDARLASGGGRMTITMDRYEADWSMVENGWRTHVEGEAEYRFADIESGLAELRGKGLSSDQYLPSFVIVDHEGKPNGKILDGDSVVFFNFRGDRAIEISLALEGDKEVPFEKRESPHIHYYGMMQYDGDLKIPSQFLVVPPVIDQTLGEYLSELGLKQFACSETQKYGHVTYFWNGNRSGKFSDKLEEYIEITSDLGGFEKRPEMKAREITDKVIEKISSPESFSFARINFANGDMVGHTGDFFAAVKAVEVVDECIGRILDACTLNGVSLIVTADHGNCDEMIEIEKGSMSPQQQADWTPHVIKGVTYRGKTSHTLNKVPCFIYPRESGVFKLNDVKSPCLAHLANTCLSLLKVPNRDLYLPSLVKSLGIV